ncbi:MAG: AI-2E family transporter [Pseudomonadota bacterium]
MNERLPLAASDPSAPTAPTVPSPLEGTPSSQPGLVHVHMPIDVRSASLAILALLGTLFAMHWASAVFIPLMLGLTFSYALTPIVNRLERWKIPRAIGAALLIVSIGGGLGWGGYALSDDAAALVDSLPQATQKVRRAIHANRKQSETAIDQMQKAAEQLEQAAHEGGGMRAATTRGVTRVRIEPAQFDINDYLWSGTLGLAASIGQAVVVVFITYFLLASGNSFRRKMVKIAGPTFAQKRITVQALDEITQQIQRYLLVQVVTSVLVGVVIWLSFWAVGLEHAAVWGVVAFAFDFIPYIGAMCLASGAALGSFLQFGSVDMALLVAGIAVGVHTLSGNLLSPWLTSRAGRMNAVTVFVGVLFFGWLWGMWGLFLGVPILMAVKAVCDRVDDLKPIGELLGT